MNAEYIVPSITIFDCDGHIDWAAMERHLEFVIAGGVDGVLILGSIGEFYAIPAEEKQRYIRFAAETVGRRVKLLVGTSAMLFEEVLMLSETAREAGADGIVVGSPYYFPLPDGSVYDYYGRLAEILPDMAIYLYNFPDRTGYGLKTEVVAGLAGEYANIVGIKDTIPGMEHTTELIRAVKPARPDFRIYSGFDINFTENVKAGGDGCIAGMANLAPELCSAWVKSVRTGDAYLQNRIYRTVEKLMGIYFVGAPFLPYMKRAVQIRRGGFGCAPAFPMREPDEQETAVLRAILDDAGLL